MSGQQLDGLPLNLVQTFIVFGNFGDISTSTIIKSKLQFVQYFGLLALKNASIDIKFWMSCIFLQLNEDKIIILMYLRILPKNVHHYPHLYDLSL